MPILSLLSIRNLNFFIFKIDVKFATNASSNKKSDKSERVLKLQARRYKALFKLFLRGLALFDEVIVAIGENSSKQYMFSIEERKGFIEKTFKNNPKIKVMTYSGLTSDFCKEIEANFILRGLRNPTDFEFEKAIAHTNRKVGEIETIFLLASGSNATRDITSSTLLATLFTLYIPPTKLKYSRMNISSGKGLCSGK